ncbi:DUF2470 domain-containing protein (plasmid) [Coraliomargarita sp. W4R53]
MPHLFDDTIVAGVVAHMNGDHTDDNLLISRAFSPASDIVSATMIGFDGDKARWNAQLSTGETMTVAVVWPGGPISERPQVRREVVALYDEACARLGVTPRPHA